MDNKTRYIALAAAIVVIAGVVLAIEQPWAPQSTAPRDPTNLPSSEKQYPAAADFAGATGWVNSPPVDLVALRGKVVLVDFWTYSCINCIHTFPHVEGFYERYKSDGFVVIGVHTPEFRFERDKANVENATQRYGLTYPTAQDNDYGIWNAYDNRYWPAEYLIDQYGRVRHTNFGEGGYAETEQNIRALLTEAGHAPTQPAGETVTSAPTGNVSPELYASAAEGQDRVAIANPEGYRPGETVTYARPSSVKPDAIYLVGAWADGAQNDTAAGTGASVIVRFSAGAANVVASGPAGACVAVLLDGNPIPADLYGRDVHLVGSTPCVTLDGPRSYDFYAGPIGEHTVELRVPAGFALFTFDFSAAAAM
ncbi:MAG: thioredoxin family protein [Thermoplasmatota archaeon]